MKLFMVSEKDGNYEVFAEVHRMGDDCLVILLGGTKPHVGAIGIAQIRPSLSAPDRISATSSVFSFLGHKEDDIAKTMSEKLSKKLKRNTVVLAGMHWENLDKRKIQKIIRICQKLINKITERFEKITAIKKNNKNENKY